MKRAWIVILLGALVGLGVVLSVLFPREAFRDPFSTVFTFEFPSFAATDEGHNLYVIDHSLSRVTKTSADGSLSFEIIGASREPGRLFYAVELAVDQRGFLYVLNQVMQENGFYTEREEILRYTPSGQFDGVVGSRVYSPAEIDSHNVTRGRLTNLRVEGQVLSWFELGTTGVLENSLSLATGALDQRLALPIQDAMVLVASVVRAAPKTLVYSTKRGEIIRQDEGLAPVVLYSGDQASAKGELSVPWWLAMAPDGALLFSDLTRGQILRRSADGLITPIVAPQQYAEKSGDRLPPIFYTFSPSANGQWATTNGSSVLVGDQSGLKTLVQSGTIPWWFLLVRGFLWLAMGAALALFLGTVWFLVTQKIPRRVSLVVKQLLVSVPLMTLLLLLVSWMLIDNFTARSEAQSFAHISQTIQLMAQSIDTDRLDRLTSQSQFMGDDYRVIRDGLHRALNDNKDPWNSKFYFALHRIHAGQIYTSMYLNDGVALLHPFTYLNDPDNLYWKAARGRIVTNKIPDAWGTWILGVGPVYDHAGRITALLEVGRDLYGFQRDTEALIWSMVPYVAGGFLVLIALFVLSTWWFLAPLRTLRAGVTAMTRGEWDIDLPIRGSDEVAELTVAFNRMTGYIRGYVDEIVALSQGYRRVVPAEFLTQLQREAGHAIQGGDRVQRDTTVLFTDLRAFTSLSETLSPRETYDLLNRCLNLIGPEVRRHEGFVGKYVGDGILALFPRSPDDALLAAIGMARLQNGEFRIGLGIHTGNLTVGIVGDAAELEGAVLSDDVHWAARLEATTPFFDTAIVISEATYHGLRLPERFQFRWLGHVRTEGRSQALGIYEVLDPLTAEVKERKLVARPALEEGIRAYQAQDWATALTRLEEALALSPQDTAVLVYQGLCRHAMSHPVPEDWNGAILLNAKGS